MSDRERRRINDDNSSNCDQGNAGSDGSSLARKRRQVDDLLNAGDDIISKVINGDSAAFLSAGQQEGGQ